MNNQVGIYEYITNDYCVAGAKMRLGIKDSSEDDLFIEDSINRGVKRLRNFGTWQPDNMTLPIVDRKAKLPPSFIKFNHAWPIVYVDEFGHADPNCWAQAPAYIDNAFYKDSPFASQDGWVYGGVVNIVSGYLWFSTDVPARFVRIAGLFTNVDDRGNILIPSIAADTVVAFACHEYAMAFPKMFTQYQIEKWGKEFKNGKKGLKGIFNQAQGLDFPMIAYTMKRIP